MNKSQLTLAAFILMFTLQANAQFSVSVNLGLRPQWHNQTHCNDDVSYYYLPEIEAYYDVNSAVFIYNGPRGWVRTAYLPEYCRDYDVNRGYRVAVNYRGHSPYVNFNSDREKYYHRNYRNYREEYYRPQYQRRNDYAEVSNHRRYNNGYNNNNYYKNERRNHNERENRYDNDRD
ncbi:MAG: hypothetical protein PHC28_05610 [Flavobacterium sp.]|uniref:hypothetical protein n=1 Tax=Flavobacterium sp. TaxID=239 RepID=UPI002635C745|nr:hypothetical protein [Flavobacterium sp.]MDD5149945.1 hypothetical protein [Flavobacterium sp.]